MTRTVGVIGGMGPLATATFIGHLVRRTDARVDQDHLRVLVDSNPAIPDRTAFLRGQGADPRPLLIATARGLEAAGCDLLVMPCNAAHAFAEDIRRAVSIPLIDWIGTAADELTALGATTVGVLATQGTLAIGLYGTALRQRGLPAIDPDAAEAAAIMDAVYGPEGVKAGGASSRSQERLLDVARSLASRGADALVLGCTELPLAVPATDPRWPVPALDPAIAVALAVIRAAGGSLTTS